MATETEYLYIFAEDLYRLGNASGPRLDHVREDDVETYERNGVTMVRSTGEGISLYDKAGLDTSKLSGWVWKIPSATPLPAGLALRPDPRPSRRGHFFLCPANEMALESYRSLLNQLALHCERTQKR